jgi:hypothetical protein
MPKLLSSINANGDSAVANVRDDCRNFARIVRVVIAGTSASVQLQGRLDANDTWFSLGTAFTTTGFQSISLPPQVRFHVTGIVAGDSTVNAWVDAYATT